MKYKFRAECAEDAYRFEAKNRDAILNMQITPTEGIPDVEVTIDCELKKSEIILLMKEIADGHVMYQTVLPINEYTGHRNYDL